MARDDRSELHISSWLDFAVPELPVQWMPFTEHGGWLSWVDYEPDWIEPRTLPPEFVLRGLGRIDVQDLDEVLGVLKEHGEVSKRFPTSHPWRLRSRKDKPPNAQNHISDVQLFLLAAQTLVEHWIAWTVNESVLAVWKRRKFTSVKDDGDAWQRFGFLINEGVKSYYPGLEVGTRSNGDTVERGAPQPSLYAALCLQLRNIVVEAIPPRICKNETCPNYFVRQYGRLNQQQHRSTGTEYCTKLCARAQAQREHHRRKTQAAKATRQPPSSSDNK